MEPIVTFLFADDASGDQVVARLISVARERLLYGTFKAPVAYVPVSDGVSLDQFVRTAQTREAH
jgi:hypothetical protein